MTQLFTRLVRFFARVFAIGRTRTVVRSMDLPDGGVHVLNARKTKLKGSAKLWTEIVSNYEFPSSSFLPPARRSSQKGWKRVERGGSFGARRSHAPILRGHVVQHDRDSSR